MICIALPPLLHLQALSTQNKVVAMLTRTSIMMLLFIVFSSAFVGNSFTSDVHDGEIVNPTSPGSEEKCTCSPCGSTCNTPSLPPPSPPPPPPTTIYSPPSPYCPPPPYYASSPPPPSYYGSNTPPPPSYYGYTPPSPNYVWSWKPPGSLYPIDPSYSLSTDGQSSSMILHAFLCLFLLALL